MSAFVYRYVMRACVILAVSTNGALAQTPELKSLFTEYTRAQIVDWIDAKTFAVGRWDGSLEVFRTPETGESTPLLLQSIVTSSGGGIEMLSALDDNTILYADREDQIAVRARSASGEFGASQPFTYDASYGVANSVAHSQVSGSDVVVTGHANGFALVWQRKGASLALLRAVDLRSLQPIQSPYPLKNIRGLAFWKGAIVLSGSEDGDIAAFNVETGNVLFHERYSPSAERGINNISVLGDKLLVVNCSVGPQDRNIWLYEIGEDGVTLFSSLNLVRDTTRPQVFNFDGDLFQTNGIVRFAASTEEGLLWLGSIQNNALVVEGVGKIADSGGASLDLNAEGIIAAAAHDVHLFSTAATGR
ncbi:hypothetical protein JJL56_26510 [Azospirillum sp. YIM DDC1]|uniref:WD40 repeat domain-containing protein n=1 Tax=Azospirillum aestuarii TaxID=2802052 RepID=A0ABS1I645_9PROT|nr:hypothetical protein [Azospirillum aestuarii]MBK4722411.1 hypothetical protein [Azospirillum aestuarii]